MAKAVPQEDEGMASHQPSPSHEILPPGHTQGTWTPISPPRLNRFLLSGQVRRQRLNDISSSRNTKGRSTASTSDNFGRAGPGCPDGETGLAGWAADESNTGGLHTCTRSAAVGSGWCLSSAHPPPGSQWGTPTPSCLAVTSVSCSSCLFHLSGRESQAVFASQTRAQM